MIIFSSVIRLFGGNVAALESPFDISFQGPWVVLDEICTVLPKNGSDSM
jgi:hypothetical protein